MSSHASGFRPLLCALLRGVPALCGKIPISFICLITRESGPRVLGLGHDIGS